MSESQHYNDWPNTQGFDVRYQELAPTELVVTGTIPSYAAGVLFRTGLGPREVKSHGDTTFKVNHWFDNLAQVHRFQIHAPDAQHPTVRVTHNSRSTCDGMIERIQKTGARDDITFAAKYDPCKSLFSKLQSVFHNTPREKPNDMSSSVTLSPDFPGLSSTGQKSLRNVDKVQAMTLCSKTDASTMQMLNPETLEPTGIAQQKVLDPQLKGPLSAAHAETDPVTGDVFNFNLELGRSGTYRVFTVSALTGQTSILATIHHAAAYIHSAFLTEHYFILCVWNSFFTAGGASILWNKNFADSLADYDASKPATWFVVDRIPKDKGGRGLIATYQSESFFCFHSVNAYETSSTSDPAQVDIVADLAAYPSVDVIKRFYIHNMLSNSPSAAAYGDPSNRSSRSVLRRFTLPCIPARPNKVPLKAASTYIGKAGICPELPNINPSFATRKHRFIYGVTDTGHSTFMDGLVKHDIVTRTDIQWNASAQTPGEPIFVADPTASADEEDAGVLFSVVLDGIAGKSYLLVLDARTMCEIGRASVDGVVGFGFHGAHIPATKVTKS